MNQSTCLIIIGLLIAIAPIQAATIVYEPFDYGADLSNLDHMNGQTISALGMTGSYNLQSAGNGGSARFSSTGLEFPYFLPTTGGSLRLGAAYQSGSSSFAVLEAAMDVGAAPGITGDLYSSFLVRFDLLADTSTQFGLRMDNGGTQGLYSYGDFGTGSRPGVAYDDTITQAGSGSLGTFQTYLVLTHSTNVGLPGGGTSTQYVFSESDYANWILNGPDEASLASYASFVTVDSSGSTRSMFDGMNFEFVISRQPGGTSSLHEVGYLDELRFGTSLFDVISDTQIPEPSSLALLVGGTFLVMKLGRKRKAS